MLNDSIEPRCKIWFSTADIKGVMGDGKFKLLQAIDECGSLRAAAEKLKISYRKAWGDLKKCETGLGLQLIEKVRGGSKGGATRLTEKGHALLTAYERFRSDIDTQIEASFNTFIKDII